MGSLSHTVLTPLLPGIFLLLTILLPTIWFVIRLWKVRKARKRKGKRFWRFWSLVTTTAILLVGAATVLALDIVLEFEKNNAHQNRFRSIQCSAQSVLLAIGPSFDVCMNSLDWQLMTDWYSASLNHRNGRLLYINQQ
jgi:hypothetical protein